MCAQSFSASVPWPDSLEKIRIDDNSLAAAYDATPAPWRAALKCGLAMTHMHFGTSPGRMKTARHDPHLGFWQQESREPVPWALIIFSPAYRAPARLAAACIPALLAGTPRLGAVCVGGPPSTAALVCLELCGVEDIFVLDSSKVVCLPDILRAFPHNGRLILLHQGELAPLVTVARELHLPCFEEWRPPCLILRDATNFDTEILAFAHGFSVREQAEDADSLPADAVYASTTKNSQNSRLLLTPGCEAFWLHQGLTPSFFTLSRHAFGLLSSSPL
ncbi:MAG: hypothetical protein IJD16_06260 [Desulfovibrio sp.]|nr:hypothetical protein [Desulfovibrio sp.]